MVTRELQCFVRGRNNEWEAICVDLDISVQGRSMSETIDALKLAICDYVELALDEKASVSEALLNRRAPWWVRAKLRLSFILSALRAKGRNDSGGHMDASLSIPCPA